LRMQSTTLWRFLSCPGQPEATILAQVHSKAPSFRKASRKSNSVGNRRCRGTFLFWNACLKCNQVTVGRAAGKSVSHGRSAKFESSRTTIQSSYLVFHPRTALSDPLNSLPKFHPTKNLSAAHLANLLSLRHLEPQPGLLKSL
jgi:hypothetical protein